MSVVQACVLTGLMLLARPAFAGDEAPVTPPSSKHRVGKLEGPEKKHGISPQRAEEIDACVVRYIESGLWVVACHVQKHDGQRVENQFMYPFNETRVGQEKKKKKKDNAPRGKEKDEKAMKPWNFFHYEPGRFAEDVALYGEACADILFEIAPTEAKLLRTKALYVSALWKKNDHRLPASVEADVFSLCHKSVIAATLASVSNVSLGGDIAKASQGRIGKELAEALAHQFGRSALIIAHAKSNARFTGLEVPGNPAFFKRMVTRLGLSQNISVGGFLDWYHKRLTADVSCARESFMRQLQERGLPRPVHPSERLKHEGHMGKGVLAIALAQAVREDAALKQH